MGKILHFGWMGDTETVSDGYVTLANRGNRMSWNLPTVKDICHVSEAAVKNIFKL